MALLPKKENTTKNIIDSIDITNESPRTYLGMSGIGDNCERKLWMNFHWTKKKSFTQRTGRIFQMGHLSEKLMIDDLKRIGLECFYRFNEKVEMTGEIGERQEVLSDIAGHFCGHIDGRVIGVFEAPETEHLLEMKTHNDKSFKLVKKNGVKRAKPAHYSQMQIYMHHTKLKRALYMAINKNDCEYYFERIEYNKSFAEDLTRKASQIIMSEIPPEKKFSKTWFECKWCEHYDFCHHGDKVVLRNCRTCQKSDICNNGKWSCEMDDSIISKEKQLMGCEMYVKGWGLGE